MARRVNGTRHHRAPLSKEELTNIFLVISFLSLSFFLFLFSFFKDRATLRQPLCTRVKYERGWFNTGDDGSLEKSLG